MRAYGFGYTLFLAAMVLASNNYARADGSEIRSDTRGTSVMQQSELASQRAGSFPPASEVENSCTYRGGPKGGCQ